MILTTYDEVPKETTIPVLHEDILEQHPTVIQGIITQKLDSGYNKDQLVIGIDPGQTIGLSIFYLEKEIESSQFNSIDELVSHIIQVLAGLRATKKIIKIGNGNMVLAKKISNLLNLKYCSDFELEFVDERSTTHKIKHHNQRGKRDMLSARYITQRKGHRHIILPLSRTG